MNHSPSLIHGTLSLREKLAQLMFVRIGSNLPPVRTVDEDAERIERLLADVPIGGLLLFNGRAATTAAVLERLQSQAQLPLLVASDIERGVGQQMHGYPLFPHAMAFDALGDAAADDVRNFARLTGELARQCGIHMAFAPVADVNVDPRNPIIATRAFGTEPERVAEMVTAYVDGARQGGLLAVAKHFPGHGNTHQDSHHELPIVEGAKADLERCELVPFRAAISAGVAALMTAHVCYPALDASGTPATLSRPILTELLRDQLGFTGAVVSDSLLMAGVKSQAASEGELALKALMAGVDLLLDVAEPHQTLEYLARSVEEGSLPLERVEDAWARAAGLHTLAGTGKKEAAGDLSAVVDQTTRTVEQVAHCAIQVVAADQPRLPLSRSRRLVACMLRPHASHLDPPQQPLAAALEDWFADCAYFEFTPESSAADYSEALAEIARADEVLLAMVVKPAAWHRFGLLEEQNDFLARALRIKPCILASLGTPVALQNHKCAAVQLCTFSDVPASQIALAEFLCSD